jgi:hypothetical protein
MLIQSRTVLGGALLAATLAFTGCGMMGMSKTSSVTVPMSASQEVPPNASGATGSAVVTLNKDTRLLTWNVTYSGTTGPVGAGHFHGPAAPGANAGVVVPFPGPISSPVSGSATITEAQMADLLAGKWYVNLHTAANPGGELRGQVTGL